jgi:hypothetical protein
MIKLPPTKRKKREKNWVNERMQILAGNLRRVRFEKHISIYRVAKGAGIPLRLLWKMERGTCRDFPFRVLVILKDYYSVSLTELCKGM